MSLKKRSIGGAKRVVSWYRPSTWRVKSWLWRIGVTCFTLAVINSVIMMWWSREPAQFTAEEAVGKYLPTGTKPVVGCHLVSSSINILESLLEKPGGFTKNDLTPPGILMDNMPEWEYGVLTVMRQTTQSLNNGFSRSQSQSAQVPYLSDADNGMRIDSSNWMFPTPEEEYKKAQANLIIYLQELTDNDPNNAQFYARADNLNAYLELVSNSLGDIGQRLSASVGDRLVNVEATREGEAQAKAAPAHRSEKTSWWKIDNNFYYARGYSWALLHQLKAIRKDFAVTLKKKGATASLDQIILELEKTQQTIWSPMILNGRPFGFSSNHSLVMGSYISRANAAIIDLQNLLRDG